MSEISAKAPVYVAPGPNNHDLIKKKLKKKKEKGKIRATRIRNIKWLRENFSSL